LNKAFMLPVLFLAFSAVARASPEPPLPWLNSSFSVQLGAEVVEFKMECPRGKLTRLSAARGEQVVEAPMDHLATLSISESCSGVSTRASHETEGSTVVTGVELRIELSREYIREELWVSFDLKSFEFTGAQRLLTYPGESTQVTRVQL